MIPIFQGKIVQGLFDPYDKEKYFIHLSTMDNEEVEVKVEKRKRRRTLKQNNYAHGPILNALSEVTGHTVGELKEISKKELGLVKSVRRKDGREIEITRSSATFTTDEFTKWCNLLKQWGDEMGIYIN